MNLIEQIETEYNVKHISSNAIAVLVESNRQQTLETIAKKYKGNYDPTKTSSKSSIGWVQFPGLKVYAKPTNRQGNMSAGIENEVKLIEKINSYAGNGNLAVEFRSSNQSIEIKDVTKCVHVGADTKGRKKADVVLKSADQDAFKLSIKKDNAEIWESADTLVSDIMKDAIEQSVTQGKVQIEAFKDVNKLSRSIAIPCDKTLALDVVFGSDLCENGAVVFKTFNESDFIYSPELNKLIINTSEIYTCIDQVMSSDHEPWILLRNDSTRKSTSVPGVRALAVTASRLNSGMHFYDRMARV